MKVPKRDTWSHFVDNKKNPFWTGIWLLQSVSSHSLTHPPALFQCPFSPTCSTSPLTLSLCAFSHTQQQYWSPRGFGITLEGPLDISYLSLPAQVPHWAPTQPSPPMNGSGNSRCDSGSGRQGGKQPGPALRLGELQSTRFRLSAAQTPLLSQKGFCTTRLSSSTGPEGSCSLPIAQV